MRLSERIENLAGRIQAKAFAEADNRPQIASVFLELSEQLFTLTGELEFDESLADERAQRDADDARMR